jgi:hypothetical protein
MPRVPWGMHPYAASGPGRRGFSVYRIRVPSVVQFRPLHRAPIRVSEGTGQATVLAGGGATVQLGPAGVGTVWYPQKVDITTTSGAADTSTCQLFKGAVSLATQIGGTSYAGGGDTFGLSGEELTPGDLLIAVWAGAKPGDTATMRVTGFQVAMVT